MCQVLVNQHLSRNFVSIPRDIGALAGQEMESRLADSVGGLRRGLAQVHMHFVLCFLLLILMP